MRIILESLMQRRLLVVLFQSYDTLERSSTPFAVRCHCVDGSYCIGRFRSYFKGYPNGKRMKSQDPYICIDEGEGTGDRWLENEETSRTS